MKRPFGITLLALVQILVGLSMLFSSMWGFSASAWSGSLEGEQQILESGIGLTPKMVSAITFFLGIVYFVLFLSSVWLARGYLKGLEWARRRGRVIALLGIAFAILAVLVLPRRIGPDSPGWSVVFNSAVYLYLGSQRARAYFGARR